MKPFKTNITLLYTFGIFHLALFLYEFFPVNVKYYGEVIQPPTDINGTSLNARKHYKSSINRVVFIVIDGLKNDFVNATNMPYVYETIQKSGCHIKMKVEPPTVTMPRIKAMTTGVLPQYIDILFNFQSVEVKEDSWLQRAKDAGKKITFYGDDTWLKLYPNMFDRSEGVSSFFVNDFYEVDFKVTNQLAHNNNWDVLILHYLGLDHIGHIHGPFNDLITLKLNDLDVVLKTIHSDIKNDDVIIITGDHGMHDLGGHGGSTEPEIHVPFIVLNKPCTKYRGYEAKQTDVASTLAALMALPLPAHSVGKILHDFMSYKTHTQFLYFLHYNALNLVKMDVSKYSYDFQIIFKQHVDYLVNKSVNVKALINSYEEQIVKTSNDLLSTSTMNQNVSLLLVSTCSLAFICLKLFIADSPIRLILFNFVATLLLSYFRSFYVAFAYSIVLSGIFLTVLFRVFSSFEYSNSTVFNVLVGGTLLRTLSMLSSSYVEFEQYIWYFLWCSVTVIAAYQDLNTNKVFLWIGLAAAVRLAQNVQLMHHWSFFFIGVFGLSYMCAKFNTNSVFVLIVLLTVYGFNVSRDVLTAQFAKCLIVFRSVLTYFKYRNITQTLIIGWVLWSALLMRPYNVILLPICLASSHVLFQLTDSIEVLTLLHIWLEETLFYCQGFANNFSSVDISPGYVGLHDYSLMYTSFQVICHTYVFRVLPLLLLLNRENRHEKIFHIYLVYRLTSFSYYCFVILVHRHHLFIWSVFSPKLLIEASHGLCLFILIIMYCLRSNILFMYKYNSL